MVIHTSYYDACDSCDVIYYVIAVRARRMVRIFLQIPPESPCIQGVPGGMDKILGEHSLC